MAVTENVTKNSGVIRITNAQESVPVSTSGTGTITSVNNAQILGVGTAFRSEINIRDWIYIKAQNAFRKVVTIVSDTELYLQEDFSTPLAGSSFNITPLSHFSEISVKVVQGAANAEIDGDTYVANEIATFSKASRGTRAFGDNKVDPIDVDATGSDVRVTVQIN